MSHHAADMDIFARTPPAGDDQVAVIRDEKCGRFVVAIFFDRVHASDYCNTAPAKALGCFLAPCTTQAKK